MPHGVILLMQFLNADSQGLIHLGALWLYVQATAGNAQRTGELTFIDRTAGSTDLACQFHLLMCA